MTRRSDRGRKRQASGRKDTIMGQKKTVRFFLTWSVLVLAFLFLRPGNAAASAQGESAPVSMEVSYGFDDTAKSDRYLRVTVLLDNIQNQDFKGNLEILAPQSSLEPYQYVYPVFVPAGQETEKELYIPLGVRADQMFVTVRGEDGEELLKKRVKLNISIDVADSFIGVFSDEPDRLFYLDGAGVRYGGIRTRTVQLSEAVAPENPLGYDQLDLIAVSDYDFGKLSDSQIRAIRRWVRDGGVLLFGGGRRFQESIGPFAAEILEPPYMDPVPELVRFDMEEKGKYEGDVSVTADCVDLNLKNGSVLLAGEKFPLMSSVVMGKGQIVVAAFSLADLSSLAMENPAFAGAFYTRVMGQERTDELSQEEYFGFSGEYFSLQGLINTGDVGRIPNVLLYTAVIAVYLLLAGPVIYYVLKRRGAHRYYMAGVVGCALVFTGIIYMLGVQTRFQEPFFTYATVFDTSEYGAEEKTFVNVRSPYNKPYEVAFLPDYEVRPLAKSYYYESTMVPAFTGKEDYRTSLRFLEDRTEIRVRDTVAFTPKLFTLRRRPENCERVFAGTATFFDGEISGTITNSSDQRLEDAVLLADGKAVLLGDLEAGQEVVLENCESLNYPLNYSYALAQAVTGGDQYAKADIGDEAYLRAQERSRFLSFYLDSAGGGYVSEARIFAFSPEKSETSFLWEDRWMTEGITMVTQPVEMDRQRDGLVYRSALEQTPRTISGNCQPEYNILFAGEPVEPATIEYFLSSDLEIESIRFEPLAEQFSGNPLYPYVTAFSGTVYFYNYDTGHSDAVTLKEEFSAAELKPYLSPSNSLTVKYVSEKNEENVWESHLPMIYVMGREK